MPRFFSRKEMYFICGYDRIRFTGILVNHYYLSSNIYTYQYIDLRVILPDNCLLCDESEKESGVVGNRLLIVDDDAGVQKMLKTLLEYEHLEVMVASDGLEALECVEHARPDLILLDLMMPRMDGRAFVEELRRRGLRTSLPVIVLTADIHAKPLVERMGVEDWLVKPFHLADLLGKVRHYLNKDTKGTSSKEN